MDTTATTQAAIPIPLMNGALPIGWGPWDMPNGWQLAPNGGPDGMAALYLTRENAAEYLNARLPFPLAPESRYRLSARLFLEEGSDVGASANAGIEFFDSAGRYLGGGYLPPVTVPGAWVEGEAEFTVPQFTAEGRLMFYLGAGKAGSARFAVPVLAPASFRWAIYPLTQVRDELPAGGGAIPFGFFALGVPEPAVSSADWRCRVEVGCETGQSVVKEALIKDGRFSVHLDPLPAGTATLRMELLSADGRSYGEREVAVTIIDEHARQARASTGCVIDRHGRAHVAGKPFMPICLYMGDVQPDYLADIAASPFNSLLPYGSPVLKFTGSTKDGVAAAREVLDACHTHGLKVIFSLSNTYDDWHYPFNDALGAHSCRKVAEAALRNFGDHPALLAWYINDEQPTERLPQMLAKRRQVRDSDPNHPVYAVMCQFAEAPFYTDICDVYGIDSYPIVDPACNHIRMARYAHDMANIAAGTDEGLPLWTVVQAHNVGAYDPQALADPNFFRANYRDPSFDEMLAMTLLAAIRGAKGFLFYSYFDLANPAFDAGARARRWDNLRRVGQTLQELEPYFMADAVAPQIDFAVLEGEVEARAFRDEAGRDCLLLVGIGPGSCRAKVLLPGDTKYISQFGRTSAQGHGGYEFTGIDICADVLISNESRG